MSMRTRLVTVLAGVGLAVTGLGLSASAAVASGADRSGSVVACDTPDTPITTGWPGAGHDRPTRLV